MNRSFSFVGVALILLGAALGACSNTSVSADCTNKCDSTETTCVSACKDDQCKTACSTARDDCTTSCSVDVTVDGG